MDKLEDFEARALTFQDNTKTVFVKGSGPAVIVMHEVPGITPEVADFARRIVEEGFTVYMPHLFGTPGREFSVGYVVGVLGRLCISREFFMLARKQSSPVSSWLRALCRQAHDECGGPGVGALGMCFTGGFALALMVDAPVMAPVLSQPANPFPVSASHRASLGLSDKELSAVKSQVNDGCHVLGLRFMADSTVPEDRFNTLRTELGDGFIAVEIDSTPGNPYNIPRSAHSVLTNDFVDEPDHPTRHAYDQVVKLFKEKLMT